MRKRGRERLLADVRERIARSTNGHPEAILSREATAEVRALVLTIGDPATDLEVAHTAGWLHWLRYLALDPGRDQKDLHAALAFLAPVYTDDPDQVPDEVRHHFDANPLGGFDGYASMAHHAAELLHQALESGDPVTLDTAIGQMQEAAAAAPAEEPERPGYLSDLGMALGTRFEWAGESRDLEEALRVSREAVATSPPGDPIRGVALFNLGVNLRTRFQRVGLPGDLDEAVAVLKQSVDTTDAHNRPTALSDLGVALLLRFQRTGVPEDLDAAIESALGAVEATPDDDPVPAGRLSNLGMALAIRFQSTGAEADLDKAVEAHRRAVDATRQGDPGRASVGANLGLVLMLRFRRAGALEDLNEAVANLRDALAAAPAGDIGAVRHQANLGTALQFRYTRAGDVDDLDESIELLQSATEALPPDHPERVSTLSNLSVVRQLRFKSTGAQAALDDAIETSREVVSLTPADHPYAPGRLSNLASVLTTRFDRTGVEADLAEGVELLGRAVSAAPADHPDRANYLWSLGNALWTTFERSGRSADLDEARSAFQRAAAIAAAPPSRRAAAAREWGRLAAASGDWADAVTAYTAAIELLAELAPRSLMRSDQEYRLSAMAGLGPEAAACCLEAAQVDRALEIWEHGRGVLLGQALDTRTDLTVLTEREPRLAARFVELRDELDAAPAPRTTPEQPGQAEHAELRREFDRRRQLAGEFERLVAEIRKLPEFRGFMLPPPVEELASAATDGPVVLVNVSAIRSDALILVPAGVDAVPLPDLTPEAVRDQVAAFLDALEDAQSPDVEQDVLDRAEGRLSEVLDWLWESVTGPVLERLQIRKEPDADEPWPRIWWCPSGLLALLPIHAAGRHATRFDADPQTVIDRTVSSYTPSLRALIHARRRSAAGDGADFALGRVLVVAMPRTPEANDLPGAAAETALLETLLGQRTKVLTYREATRSAVRTAMSEYSSAHFACHAASDLTDPSASHILLYDHRTRPFTVLDVARLRLDDQALAFLSACSTSRTGERLPDESIHLASAFQLAGYRQVIATLWQIGDRPAVRVTTTVYTALRNGSTGEVAHMLHNATRRLRAILPARPSIWAAHTHNGP